MRKIVRIKQKDENCIVCEDKEHIEENLPILQKDLQVGDLLLVFSKTQYECICRIRGESAKIILPRQYGKQFEIELMELLPKELNYLEIQENEQAGEESVSVSLVKNIFQQFQYICITLLSSGRRFVNETFVKSFAQFPARQFIVGLSLYGYDSYTHDTILKKPGDFKQTVIGIQNLSRAGVGIVIQIEVNKWNYLFLRKIVGLIGENFPFIRFVYFTGFWDFEEEWKKEQSEQNTIKFLQKNIEKSLEYCSHYHIVPRLMGYPLEYLDQRHYKYYCK